MVLLETLNIFESSSLGAIFTHGNPNSDKENVLGGFDFNYFDSKLFDDWVRSEILEAPRAPIVGLLFCTVVGVIYGMLPAIKASRLNPIDALRYE